MRVIIIGSQTYVKMYSFRLPAALPRGDGGADGTVMMSSFSVQTFFRSQPGIGAQFGHAKMLALVTETTKPFLFRISGFVSINRNSREH
jgi:hypothetical protein